MKYNSASATKQDRVVIRMQNHGAKIGDGHELPWLDSVQVPELKTAVDLQNDPAPVWRQVKCGQASPPAAMSNERSKAGTRHNPPDACSSAGDEVSDL